MISDQVKDSLIDQIIKGLIGQGTEGVKPVLELLFNAAMKIERESSLGLVPMKGAKKGRVMQTVISLKKSRPGWDPWR